MFKTEGGHFDQSNGFPIGRAKKWLESVVRILRKTTNNMVRVIIVFPVNGQCQYGIETVGG